MLEVEGTYRGREGMREWWDGVLAVLPDWNPQIVDSRDLGGCVVSRVRAEGRGTGSGISYDRDIWHSRRFATAASGGRPSSAPRPRPSKPRGSGSRDVAGERGASARGLRGLSRAGGRWDTDLLHPDVVWTPRTEIFDISRVYHGTAGVAEFWREWLGAWETVQFEYKLVDGGDQVVALVDQQMRGRSTEIEVPLGKYAHLYAFRDGLIVHWKPTRARLRPSKRPGCGTNS